METVSNSTTIINNTVENPKIDKPLANETKTIHVETQIKYNEVNYII